MTDGKNDKPGRQAAADEHPSDRPPGGADVTAGALDERGRVEALRLAISRGCTVSAGRARPRPRCAIAWS